MLAASDSHFSIAAAQISLGVQLRIRRQGFAAADVQHMIPLPLMATDAEVAISAVIRAVIRIAIRVQHMILLPLMATDAEARAHM